MVENKQGSWTDVCSHLFKTKLALSYKREWFSTYEDGNTLKAAIFIN